MASSKRRSLREKPPFETRINRKRTRSKAEPAHMEARCLVKGRSMPPMFKKGTIVWSRIWCSRTCLKSMGGLFRRRPGQEFQFNDVQDKRHDSHGNQEGRRVGGRVPREKQEHRQQ